MLNFIDDFTIICRCEEVNRIEIETSISRGTKTLDDIKRMTRCGMGPCQWKTCRTMVSKILMDKLQNDTASDHNAKIRFPLTPISIGDLATMQSDDDVSVIDILHNAMESQSKVQTEENCNENEEGKDENI